jgi:hypothetical protein
MHISYRARVVINSEARQELACRRGIAATLIPIPNAMDFENPPIVSKERVKTFRRSIGIRPDDMMFLQPTRVVQNSYSSLRKQLFQIMPNLIRHYCLPYRERSQSALGS